MQNQFIFPLALPFARRIFGKVISKMALMETKIPAPLRQTERPYKLPTKCINREDGDGGSSGY
jgi:hypothetical protein